jgi:UDP-N-acetyl-D-mannosaminuronate dehydrogenase
MTNMSSDRARLGDGSTVHDDATVGYEHVEVGYNYRMPSVAAGMGLAQLEKLPEFTAARRRNAKRLSDALAFVPAVETPVEPPGTRHVYHQYTVRCRDRDALRESLDAAVLVTAHDTFDDIDWDAVSAGRGPDAAGADRHSDDGIVVVDGRQALDLSGTRHRQYTIGRGGD